MLPKGMYNTHKKHHQSVIINMTLSLNKTVLCSLTNIWHYFKWMRKIKWVETRNYELKCLGYNCICLRNKHLFDFLFNYRIFTSNLLERRIFLYVPVLNYVLDCRNNILVARKIFIQIMINIAEDLGCVRNGILAYCVLPSTQCILPTIF